MKQALRSYLASIHPRNIKKLKEMDSAIQVYIYLYVYGIYLLAAILPGKTAADWIFSLISLLIPVFFMGWSDLSSRYLMPKPMFLCPMKEDMRKEYIRCVLKCKIGGPMLLGILINLIWCIDYGFQVWRLLLLLFFYFSAGIAYYMAYEYRPVNGKKVPFNIQDEDGKIIYPWVSTAVLVITILGIAVLVLLPKYSPEVVQRIFPIYILLGGVILISLLVMDIEIIKKQFPYIMKNVGDYERNFKIQIKKTAPQKFEFGKKQEVR